MNIHNIFRKVKFHRFEGSLLIQNKKKSETNSFGYNYKYCDKKLLFFNFLCLVFYTYIILNMDVEKNSL
jgi:hypothetical protein